MKRSGLPRKSSLLRKGRLRQVSKKGRKAISLDKLLSKVVRARDGRCVLAEAGLGACGGNLQASHIYPKGRHQAMRYMLDNVLTACFAHHSPKSSRSWHTNPLHYAEWFNRSYPTLAAKLLLISQVPGKVDRKLDRLYLEAEARKLGVTP